MGRSTGMENTQMDIALGKVPGMVQFEQFGVNNLINILSTPEDVWGGGGIYTGLPLGAAETLEVFSSDAVDNGTGTGARTVIISNLLDENYNLMPEVTVTLNGVTPVSLGVQTYIRCSKMRVETAGTGGVNAGTLTLRHTTTVANIFANMSIGKNQTAIMAFTVPLGKKILIHRGYIGMGRLNGSNGSAEVTIRLRDFGPDKVFHQVRSPAITNSNGYLFENNGYFVFNEKQDIKVTVDTVSDDNTFVTAEADGYIIDA